MPDAMPNGVLFSLRLPFFLLLSSRFVVWLACCYSINAMYAREAAEPACIVWFGIPAFCIYYCFCVLISIACRRSADQTRMNVRSAFAGWSRPDNAGMNKSPDKLHTVL